MSVALPPASSRITIPAAMSQGFNPNSQNASNPAARDVAQVDRCRPGPANAVGQHR